MEFRCIETVKYPLPLVWATLRDRLHTIAEQQDDIEYVKVEKRSKKNPDSLHVISTWHADPPLPGFLKGFIKPDMLTWTDDAIWQNGATTCHFTITPHYQVEDIRCVGTIAMEAAGAKSTRIIYSGTLTITKTARSSIFMTSLIIRGIEALAGKLIEHNFAKVVKELVAMIKADK
jgi:hypothetical protein